MEKYFGTETMTMDLKVLADNVLTRDSAGTKRGTDFHILSRTEEGKNDAVRALNFLPLTQKRIEEYQERAAIMEYSGGFTRAEAETLAFEDLQEQSKEQASL